MHKENHLSKKEEKNRTQWDPSNGIQLKKNIQTISTWIIEIAVASFAIFFLNFRVWWVNVTEYATQLTMASNKTEAWSSKLEWTNETVFFVLKKFQQTKIFFSFLSLFFHSFFYDRSLLFIMFSLFICCLSCKWFVHDKSVTKQNYRKKLRSNPIFKLQWDDLFNEIFRIFFFFIFSSQFNTLNDFRDAVFLMNPFPHS